MENGRVWVEAWSPEYGAAVESDRLPASEEVVSAFVETDDWAPMSPQAPAWPPAAFVDGVHRVDARAWFESDEGLTGGLLACLGAGSVISGVDSGGHFREDGPSRAWYGPSATRRVAVFGGGASVLVPPVSSAMSYESVSVYGTEVSDLMQAVQHARSDVELEMARALAAHGYLVVADGPLLARREHEAIIGMIKSHQRTYLTPDLEPVVRELEAGQRTPLFHFGRIRPRYSWYMRLADVPGQHPWAGVVRCEVSATLSFRRAAELADLTTVHLPRFASRAFWDHRAPQNLVPIASLERRLWHLLGDREIVLRQIRSSLLKMSA